MAKDTTDNKDMRDSIQEAFRRKRQRDPRNRPAPGTALPARRPQTARLLKGSSVIMAKPTETAENDLSLDIADAVGKTVGNIVNRIEALDSERAELIKKLQDARSSLNDQFSKWLPAGVGGASALGVKRRRSASDNPCPICHIKGHDKRHHRNHPAKFTKDELRARNLPTGD